MYNLSDNITRKFTDVVDISDDGWEVMTDTGYEPISDIKQTEEYEIWEMMLVDGTILRCADNHILFDENFQEIFVCSLKSGDCIQTQSGPQIVEHVINTHHLVNMYDLGVNSNNHRFYSNGILSHNTTTAAGYLLWFAMFKPDSTILVAAHKYAGAQEIMQRIRYAYESTPNHIRAGVTSYNKGSIEFENGSRIISTATTENTGRGLSITLLYLDEFAFVRNTIAQEFWTSISPTLSTGGKAIITSTPNSDEDQFWQLWLEANKTVDEFGNETGIGRNGFKAFTALWNEHPDRDQKWADDELGRIGSEKFSREHLCQPIIFEETLINAMTLSKLSAIDPVDKLGQVRWYKKPSRGNTYAIGVDPSLGTGGDYSAIEIYELPSFEQVGEWQHNKTPIQGQVRILRDIIKYIYDIIGTENDIYYSIENNGVGEATLMSISEVGEQNIKGIFLSEGGKSRKGFTTTHKSKLTACAKFKQLIEMGKLKINSKNLISELKTFVRANLSYAARVGDTDDLVSASLLVIRIMQTLQNYDSEIDNQMRANDEFVAPLPFIMI